MSYIISSKIVSCKSININQMFIPRIPSFVTAHSISFCLHFPMWKSRKNKKTSESQTLDLNSRITWS